MHSGTIPPIIRTSQHPGCLFRPQLAVFDPPGDKYLERARQTEPFDADIYEDEEVIDLESKLDLRRSAADLLLVERAKEWLLGE